MPSAHEICDGAALRRNQGEAKWEAQSIHCPARPRAGPFSKQKRASLISWLEAPLRFLNAKGLKTAAVLFDMAPGMATQWMETSRIISVNPKCYA